MDSAEISFCRRGAGCLRLETEGGNGTSFSSIEGIAPDHRASLISAHGGFSSVIYGFEPVAAGRSLMLAARLQIHCKQSHLSADVANGGTRCLISPLVERPTSAKFRPVRFAVTTRIFQTRRLSSRIITCEPSGITSVLVRMSLLCAAGFNKFESGPRPFSRVEIPRQGGYIVGDTQRKGDFSGRIE